MHKELLVLTWLNGQVQFLSIRNGKVEASSECKHKVDLADASANFAELIKVGAKQAKYTGKNLAIVLEHDQLTQQLLETPPAKGRDLELFIERQVDQLKICEGEVAWSFQQTHPIKDSNGLVLYLLPEAVCERLTRAAKLAGLHLLMILSPSALLNRQIAEMPLKGDEIALVVAETAGTTLIVVGRKDGTVFLTRSLQCSWESDPDRIASQINRSTVFLRQQFGYDVGQVVLLGRGAEGLADVMSKSVVLPVTYQDEEVTPTHWATHLASLPADASANLISREQQRAPHRKLMVLLTAGLLTMLGVVSIAVCFWIEMQVRGEVLQVAALQPKLADLQMRKADLVAQMDKLAADEQLTTYINDKQLPPAPGVFLTYLSTVIPNELILTKMQIKRVDHFSGESEAPPEGSWEVHIEGSVSWDASGETAPSAVQAAYLRLTDELTSGPFHVSITDKTRRFKPSREKPSWAVSSQGSGDQFFIEGLMHGGAIQ